jgi:hypothetical protein
MGVAGKLIEKSGVMNGRGDPNDHSKAKEPDE